MSLHIAGDPNDETKININNTCPVCDCRSFIQVDLDPFIRWLNGEFIQDVWPELDAGQRELIKTGTHPDCWDQMSQE